MWAQDGRAHLDIRRAGGLIAGVFAVLIWAGWIVWTAVQMRASGDGPSFTPFDIALLRYAPPTLLLAPFWLSISRPAQSFKPKQTRWCHLLLMVGWGAPFAFFAATGLQQAGPSLMAALVPGLAPFLAAGLGVALFGARTGMQGRIGLMLIALAALAGLWAAPAAERAAAPWFLAAALGWGGYIAAAPHAGLRPAQAVGLISAWSCLLLLLAAPFAPSNLLNVPLETVLAEFILQGAVAGSLSVLAYTIALDRAPPMIASNMPVAVPLLAAAGAAAFTNAAPSGPQVAGLTLATAGLLVLSTADRAKRR